ncbi:MAG TPA: PAS domain-containing protein [Sphingobacteriaceae bacterium]
MKEHAVYRYLEGSAFAIFAIIIIAIILLFLNFIPLPLFKAALLILLISALIVFAILRKTIRQTINIAKSRLKTAEHKFRHIYESDVIGITIINFEGQVLDSNNAYLKMLGYSSDDVRKGAVSWAKLTPPEFADATNQALAQLKATGTCQPFEKQYYKKDGSRIWVLIGATVLQEDEKAGDAVTYIIDFTNVKEAESRAQKLQKLMLRQQQEFKSILMDAPAVITIRRGPELRYTFVNRTVMELSGKTDFSNKTHQEMFGKFNFEAQRTAQKVLATGEPEKETRRRLEYLDDHGKKRELYFNFILNPVFDSEGRVDGVAVFGFDVTDMVRANQEMAIGKERFEFIAEAMPHKVWMSDRDGYTTYVNKAWLDYVGADDISGFNWEEIIHPDDQGKAIADWQKALKNKTEFTAEQRYKRVADNEYRWHLIKAYPLKDENGELAMWVGVNTDIHDQKLQQRELVESHELLNKKDEFLSIASHELKTPLTNIKATVQLLDKAVTNDHRASLFSSKALQHIGRLERLISDLLDVSKINAGALVYNKTDISFGPFLKETVEDIQQQTFPHQIIIKSIADVTLHADKERIEQVLHNLISNAAKYSPNEKEIVVTSGVEGKQLVVSVRDFGIGIDDEAQQNLFTRYYRVEETSMKYQGLGIGLFICKEIIERHGGELKVESEPGKGSTFYFTLPLQEN